MTALDPHSSSHEAATFGKYRLVASLGHGGMADVFLAIAQGPVGFNKLQVIKRLRPNLAEEADFLNMFLDEARLAARLNHPNIVQTNEVGEVAGQYFIAMEYLDGQPLHRIIHRGSKNGGLSRSMSLKIIADTLAGLHAAHELTDYDGAPLNVVHRDVSPHNIFVTYDGQTKVVDFGIAKAATRTAETRTGVLKGKINYMAPEQARTEYVDRRADIFSVGVILWELLTGSRLWKNMSDVEILDRLMHGEIQDIASVTPGLPPELILIVRRALAPSMTDRYSTAVELRQDLLTHLARDGGRLGDEEIGSYVSTLFQDKRQQLKGILEKQLAGLKTGQFEGVRIMDLPAASVSLPRITQSSVSDPTPSNTLNAYSPTSGVLSQPPQVQQSSSRKAPFIVGGAAVLAVIVGALVLKRGGAAPNEANASPPSAVTAAETAAPPAETAAPAADTGVATIEMTIQVTPAEAEVYLDDAKLEPPYSNKFRADGLTHRLRVEAPGHQTNKRMVVFDKDLTINVTLDPEEAAAAQAPVNRTQPVSKPGSFAKPPGKPTKKKLDSSDPWAN